MLRTPIKIEKLSFWNRTASGFIMNFEFHGFLGKNIPSQSSPVRSGRFCMVFRAVPSIQSGPVRSGLWSSSSLVQSLLWLQVRSPSQVQGLVRSSQIWSGLRSSFIDPKVKAIQTKAQSYKRKAQSLPWSFPYSKTTCLKTFEQNANRHK